MLFISNISADDTGETTLGTGSGYLLVVIVHMIMYVSLMST